ncbi:hypothetical protein EYF80_033380 [Liparis tanakae]|uniref:Uncharacterized protein n=1 Tax=Liparis tanakae TaxID=230148 RepID=A0A4Z2GSP9_9TELE|nr:hypothetical protein EYF80_033380 [Liparis tanakae]
MLTSARAFCELTVPNGALDPHADAMSITPLRNVSMRSIERPVERRGKVITEFTENETETTHAGPELKLHR